MVGVAGIRPISLALSLALALTSPRISAASLSAARKTLLRGISYGPAPLKTEVEASQLKQDDWFCDEAVPLWGRAGRGDLKIMKELGANFVRLYGNNPENDHTTFLDEALAEGLFVGPGMSDYPYYQMIPGNCLHFTNFNCYTQVKSLYLGNLRRGFLRPDNTYHPAIKFMNILNEPDLKIPPTADLGGPEGVAQMCKALISAFDAMLDAEREAQVAGPLINFTATFSFAVCSSCGWFAGKPGLGQMAALQDAMMHPAKYGYIPNNNITEAYLTRFTHSFNTPSPAAHLQAQFFDGYSAFFPNTPVYIAEYHWVFGNQTTDLDTAMGLAEKNPLLLGISFFQYQVAYCKAGPEQDFGMFEYGDYKITTMPYFSQSYDVRCVLPRYNTASGTTVPAALAGAYGGEGVNSATMCVANPEGVSLDQTGYEEIAAQNNAGQMALFVERVISHLGGAPKEDNPDAVKQLAQTYADGANKDFTELAHYLGSRPDWIWFDSEAKCVADRMATPTVVSEVVGRLCSEGMNASCADLPYQCANNTYRTADFVFSRYYAALEDANPLVDCYFGGAALFASSKTYSAWTGASQCVERGTTVTITTMATNESSGLGIDTTAQLTARLRR